MAPTYAPVSSDENAPAQTQHVRTRPWIKVLWVVQAFLALLRMLLVALLVAAMFILASVLGAVGVSIFYLVVLWILLVIDMWLNGFIIVQVWQQFAHPQTAKVALRREVYKAAIATWLFVSFVGTTDKPKAYAQLNEEQKKGFDEAMERMWIVNVVVVLVAMGAFYPPLWVAWKERREEKQRGEGGGIELEDHAVGAEGFVEPDGDGERAKLRV